MQRAKSIFIRTAVLFVFSVGSAVVFARITKQVLYPTNCYSFASEMSKKFSASFLHDQQDYQEAKSMKTLYYANIIVFEDFQPSKDSFFR